MFRLHVSPAGHTESGWVPTAPLKCPRPYSCCLPGIRYGPNVVTSTPIFPCVSSIQ